METNTPRTEGASMTVLDEIDNFRISCEDHLVDALLRMESLHRKILSSKRTWSDYPDTFVPEKFDNAFPGEYGFQRQLLKSREGHMTREATVTVTRDQYESPES